MLEEMADALADLRAARFAKHDDFAAALFEPFL
jgi:hypothetical protein